MNRKNFLKLIPSIGLFTMSGDLEAITHSRNRIKIRLLRHATMWIEINKKKILVDPLLAQKSAYDPVRWTSNGIRNPIVDLPIDNQELQDILGQTDAVLVTHTHRDHWDEAAQKLISKNTPIIGQPEDAEKFKLQGFESIISVHDTYSFEGITITKVKAQHGTGEIAQKMAPVSGFVLDDGSQKIYIAGDTVWCNDVEKTIVQYQPDFIVLNAGAAQFDMGDPITMTAEDVLKVCKLSVARKIICVHMETINHCYLKRTDLHSAIQHAKEAERCLVPYDGEVIALT